MYTELSERAPLSVCRAFLILYKTPLSVYRALLILYMALLSVCRAPLTIQNNSRADF